MLIFRVVLHYDRLRVHHTDKQHGDFKSAVT